MSEINVARLVKLDEPLELGKVAKPTPGPTDVLVKVEACCLVPNSYNLVTGKAELPIPELPCIFGLDVAGTIESVGEHVLNLKEGDRVYVDPFMWCRTCHFCKKGRKDVCQYWSLRGYFSNDANPTSRKLLAQYPIGGLSEYVLAPDTNLVVLPQSIDFNLASRFGYIGTSFAALKRVDTGPGKTLLINGVTGTLGYAAVAIALGLGCTRILGIGRNKERLAEVAGLGKNNRVVTRSSEDDGDIAEWIKEQTHGLGPDVLYDCLGVGGDAGGTMKLINTVKTGGSAILAAGGAEGDLTQTYAEAMQHQVSIVGSNWFSGDHIEELVDLVDAGVIDFGYLSHKVFPLKEVNEAFKFVGDRPGGAVNVVVQPQGKMSGD